jgi:hypothetical protein
MEIAHRKWFEAGAQSRERKEGRGRGGGGGTFLLTWNLRFANAFDEGLEARALPLPLPPRLLWVGDRSANGSAAQ